MRTGRVSNVTTIDTLIVEGVNNCFAGRILRDTAHENRFMTIASKGSSGICSATAGAKLDFININLGAKLELVKKAAAISAEIVVINKVDVLQGRTD